MNKLNDIRELMIKHNIQAYLVPSTDPHQSEYVPAMWERRKWFSGFTGSAGDMAITLKKAGLWTDSRYFLQAEHQLKATSIELFKMGLPGVPSIEQWLKTVLNPGDRVGIDPRLFSVNQVDRLKNYLNEWKIELISMDVNLIDKIWTDRPYFPDSPIEVLPVIYSGEDISSKLRRVHDKMQIENTQLHVLTTLDSIAWLFNIRGSDIEYNPVVISYAILTEERALLFANLNKITPELKHHFSTDVEFYDYMEFENRLLELLKNVKRVWLDKNTVSQWIVNMVGNICEIFYKETPVTVFKAIKNPTELKGFKNAHIRDGAAMVKFLHWLEQNLGHSKISEISASRRLEKFRAEGEHFIGPSFSTISAYKEHGAIVHYESTPETDVELKADGIYLIDSGGQYLDGTTDITRTLTLGEPTQEQKNMFTLVLKGMIQLSITSFPRGTAGKQLDTIARLPLWRAGVNFGHGVGHGIGHYLNVHEGPQAISYYRCTGVALEPGMVTSNEPGFYKEGEYGIRIENLIATIKDEEKSSDQFEFYTFETLTMCPIDLKLIDKSLLSQEEILFLNNYHLRVREALTPLLNNKDLSWLKHATREI